MRVEENPHVQAGTDESRQPATQALLNRKNEIDDRKHGRGDFDPARVVPGTDELDRQLADHVPPESGGASPGRTFMTNINCGAFAAARAISSARTRIT